MNKLKVGVIGSSHPHAGLLYNTLAVLGDCVEFVGYSDVVTDETQADFRKRQLGSMANEALQKGTLKQFDSWQDIIAQKPDAVIVTADNKACTDIMCHALDEKITVINEKPLASDLEDAKRIAKCSLKSGAPVITNWPITWFAAFQKAKELACQGAVGDIMRVVYRSPATWGPFEYTTPVEDKQKTWWFSHKRGGGSLLDYACYGTILSTWIFGKCAKRVSAITKQFTTEGISDVEDYSAMILDFGNGVGLLEGSWSTFNCGEVATGPVIYGKEGTIVCDRYSNLVKVYHSISHTPVEPTAVYDTDDNSAFGRKLGEHLKEYFEGKVPLNEMLTLDMNMDVMAALDAGMKSAENGSFAMVEDWRKNINE